ncbi:MAG: DUF2341 domain-containing protein [Candidatus Thermoplasmatota archaeon]
MGEIKLRTIVSTVLLSLGMLLSVAQIRSVETTMLSRGFQDRGGSLVVWHDDFFDTGRIDVGLTRNCSIDTSAGVITMQNTYAAWTNPSFTRMRPINITNTGLVGLHNYVLELNIPYDSDMQTDYDDLRFTNAQGISYEYWILERTMGVSARVLVLIPYIAPQQTITMYLFYGNPTAVDQGNFNSVFTWQDLTQPDVMISYKNENEGAWDPDVAYGGGRFLTAWEERLGPEDLGYYLERSLPSVILGRTFDVNGSNPQPPKETGDIRISRPDDTSYHAENPSIAYGAGKFFVCWEENPATIADRFKSDIKGAFVALNGTVLSRFTICSNADGGQYDPHVCYDARTNRFMVVWEDARAGADNYDIWGKIYFPSGTSYVEFCVTPGEVHCQSDPWVCSDEQGNFFVVYEDGYDPQIGPFSLKARRFSPTGPGGQPVQNGSTISIATGSSTVDHIFPAVVYNPVSQRYLVTWNDADISVDPTVRSSYDGNIWGKILDVNGATVITNFIITPGTSNIRTDVVPFFNSMFFVSYDSILGGSTGIWGKLVSSSGVIHGAEVQLTDGSSQNVDWNNLAVGEGNIFCIWEDERDVVSLYADAFGSVWSITQKVGSPFVSYALGEEYKLITNAVVTSTVITPDSEFIRWHRFSAAYTVPVGVVRFDILNADGTVVLRADVNPGEDLSAMSERSCRLRATLTRSVPTSSPVVDAWNISWYRYADMEPPHTQILFDPAVPDGSNNWYTKPIRCTFVVSDNDSAPSNITTFYRMNQGETKVYDPANPPFITSERPDNMIEYWSKDTAENEETPHHVITNIALDRSPPMVTIVKPPELVFQGLIRINGSVTEYASGSGIQRIEIRRGSDILFNATYTGEKIKWFDTSFSASYGETYDILVISVDQAGLRGIDRRTVRCSEKGIYQIGYLYITNHDKIGPVHLLTRLGVAVVVDFNVLVCAAAEIPDNAVAVEFVATQQFLKKTYTCWDTNVSDGAIVNLSIPSGFYELSARLYDADQHQVGSVVLIKKILVVILQG